MSQPACIPHVPPQPCIQGLLLLLSRPACVELALRCVFCCQILVPALFAAISALSLSSCCSAVLSSIGTWAFSAACCTTIAAPKSGPFFRAVSATWAEPVCAVRGSVSEWGLCFACVPCEGSQLCSILASRLVLLCQCCSVCLKALLHPVPLHVSPEMLAWLWHSLPHGAAAQ